MVKESACNAEDAQETWVPSLGLKDPLEKEMATQSSILAWRIQWTEKPAGLQSMGSQRVRQEWATEHSHIQEADLGFPGGTSGKEPACQCQRHGFDPWVRKIPWRRKWQLNPVFSPGKSNGQRSWPFYNPWGCKTFGHFLVTKQQRKQQQRYLSLGPVWLFVKWSNRFSTKIVPCYCW